jgi:hypothetical protein
MLTVLFPSLPLQRAIDPMWAEEYAAAQASGYAVALFDAEQPKIYGPLPARPTLYRGWMLTEKEYHWLEARCQLLVPYEQYAASHLATGWYPAIKEFTPASQFLTTEQWVQTWETGVVAGPQFVKGLVKSFGAESGISSLAEARQLVQRQQLEAAETLFVREFVALGPAPEQRFFAVGPAVFGPGGAAFPAALRPAIDALRTRAFYSVDVAYTAQGQPFIIEVGDGQVSDVKEWPVAELYQRVVPALARGVAG